MPGSPSQAAADSKARSPYGTECPALSGYPESLHGEQLAVHGVVRLIQNCTHRRHLGVFEYRVSARFFGLKPVANTLAVRLAHRRVDAIGKMAQALTQGHHSQAFALSTPMQQSVEL